MVSDTPNEVFRSRAARYQNVIPPKLRHFAKAALGDFPIPASSRQASGYSAKGNKGFSLIEILVVCVVIIGITGLAISNYSAFTETQKIKQAGRTLKNNLRFIQTRSASGLKPPDCNNTNPLLSYRVTFTASTYTYQPICSSGTIPGTSMMVTLPAGVTFTPVPAAFDFRVLTGASSATTTMTLFGLTKQYSIQVTQNGNIEDLGFQ